MTFEGLSNVINSLNKHSDFKYVVTKMARNRECEHYNDRKIQIYFVNDGCYKTKNRLIKLIEIHDHRYGAINSLSQYMGAKHDEVFRIALTYVLQRRSQRAPLTDGRFNIGQRFKDHDDQSNYG